jgi:hypothetical protein
LATANLISGISVSAIGEVPLAGSFTPVARTFERSSSGNIQLTAYKVNTGSGLAGSALAEFPQSGTVTTYVQTTTQKINAPKGLIQSSGTLALAPNGFDTIVSYGRNSSGSLKLSGSVETQSLRFADAYAQRGSIKVGDIGSAVSFNNSSRLVNSTVNLLLTLTDTYRIRANTTSTTQLVTTGTTVRTRLWNRVAGVGSLKITTVSKTEFKPSISSITVLPFVNKRQGGTTSSGLFVSPLASVPIAGSPLQEYVELVTTVTFQGSASSTGALVIQPVGEFVRTLSESGTFSGDALASQAIASQDTQYRPSQYASVRQFQSAGNVVIVVPGTAVNYVETSSGDLLISTVSVTETKLNVNSDDQLLLSTDWVYERKISPVSIGNLLVSTVGQKSITESGVLAGAPLASLTLSGEYDSTQTKFASVRNFESSGNLDTRGSFQLPTQKLLVLSTGQLVTTSDLVFRKTINHISSGSLKLIPTIRFAKTINHLSTVQLVTTTYGVSHLTDVGSISGSAIAGLPLGGNSGVVEYINNGITGFAQRRTVVSTGTLNFVVGATGQGSLNLILSSGNLIFAPNLLTRSLRNESTSGQLRLTSNLLIRSIRTELSSGSFTLVNTDAYRDRLNIISTGLLKLTGSNVHSSSQIELTSGQLKLSTVSRTQSTEQPTSFGVVTFSPVGQSIVGDSSGIAGAAIAVTPIGGGNDFVDGKTKFKSLRNESSSGSLTLSTSTNRSSLRLVLSSVQLKLNTTSVTRLLVAPTSTSTLKLSSSLVTRSLRKVIGTGYTNLVNVDAYRDRLNILSSGQLRLNGSTTQKFNQTALSIGNLVLYTNKYTQSTIKPTSFGVVTFSSIGQSIVGDSSGIAGTAIAVTPISGGVDFVDGKTKFKSRRNITSTGRLLISQLGGAFGQLTLVESSGQLKLTSSLLTSGLRNESTSGQLKLTSNVLNRSIRNESSSGSFTLINTDVYRDRLNIISNGSLKLTGYNVHSSLQTELTTGQLVLTKSYVTNSIRTEQSIGVLYPASKGYNYFGNASGISGSALSSLPLSGGSPVEVFLGNGQTNYLEIRHFNSSGLLKIYSGPSEGAQKYLALSSGQMVLSGSTTQQSVRTKSSNVQLKLTSSLLSRSIRTENSIGYTTLVNVDAYRDRLNIISTGLLKLSSVSLYRDRYNRATSGQTILSTVSEFNKSLDFLSTGRLHTYYITEKPNSINGISGAPLASTPIAGEVELTQRSTIRVLQNITSVGYLNLNGVDVPLLELGEISTGQLKLTGTTLSQFKTQNSSSGSLSQTSDSSKNRTITQNSNVNLISLPYGDLNSVDSSISSDAIATSPIAGGNRNTRYVTRVSYILNGVEYRAGVIDSSVLLKLNTYAESYRGYLRDSSGSVTLIPGQDLLSYSQPSRGYLNIVFPERVGLDKTGGISTETLAGVPLAAGSNNVYSQVNTIYNSLTLHESSSGGLKLFPYGENSIGSSSAIAGSSLAQLSIAGGFGYNRVQAVVTKPSQDRTSAGTLSLSSTTVKNRTLTFVSNGQIKVYGPDVVERNIFTAQSNNTIYLTTAANYNISLSPTSSSTLVTTGNTDIRVIGNKSYGYLTISGRNGALIPVSSDIGVITLSGSSIAITRHNEESSGTFVVVGTDVGINLARGEPSNGTLYVTSNVFVVSAHRIESSGNVIIVNTDVGFNIAKGEPTSGVLITTGSAVVIAGHRVESSGNNIIVGTDVGFNIAKGEPTSGIVYVTGTTGRVNKVWGVNSTTTAVFTPEQLVQSSLRTVDSVGSLILFYKTEKYYETSNGFLVTTGSVETEFLSPEGDLQRFVDAHLGGGGYTNPRAFSFWNKKPKAYVSEVQSSGSIGTITGSVVATKYINFAKKQPPKQVVEVSSTPSRFILKTFGLDPRTTSNNSTGAVNVKGNTQVEFIRSMNAMAEMDANSIAINRIRQRILMEDEMLLNGSLTNLDPLQDELDGELF